MSKTIEVTNQNFEKEVLQSDLPILVDFWAPWCQPCLMMSPILDSLAEELSGKLRIGKVNIENPNQQLLATKYQVQGIPNMKLFRNGKMIKEFVGLRKKETFKTELEEALEQN